MKCKFKGRDEYLGIDSTKTPGGIHRFETMDVEQAQKCLAEGWMDPDDSQNASPTNQDMVDFIKANPAFRLHGYIVSTTRDDARISIEGVSSVVKPTRKQLLAFVDMFRCADDFDMVHPCYAWFD